MGKCSKNTSDLACRRGKITICSDVLFDISNEEYAAFTRMVRIIGVDFDCSKDIFIYTAVSPEFDCATSEDVLCGSIPYYDATMVRQEVDGLFSCAVTLKRIE